MARPKDPVYRVNELKTALEALRDANNHFQKTHKSSYMLTISAQLRALVCTGGVDMTPLLLDLAGEAGAKLLFYAPPVPQNPSPGLKADSIAGKSWSVYARPGLQLYDLREWLQLPRYYVDLTKDYRTTEQVLKHVANKQGGAHYDKSIAPIIDQMERITIGTDEWKMDGLQLFLIDMGALVCWLGNRLGLTMNCLANGKDPATDSRIADLDKHFDSVVIGLPIGSIQLFGPPD